MKFATFPLSQAEGAILAHSIATKRGVIKKGRVLTAAEIERLAEAGLVEVMAARLEAGDVGEDEAARRIALAATGAGVRAAEAFTGRANLIARHAGLAVINAEAVARINALDEGLTIATLAPFERVSAGQMLATVKVITFAVSEAVVAQAERLLLTGPKLALVMPFQDRSAGLVLTRMPATKASVLAKRRDAIASRLTALGSRLGDVEMVPHGVEAVRAAIDRLAGKGLDPIIVFAASAIVDRGDVIPAALVAAGGRIVRLGMPVDPGNMMLLGQIRDQDVIGAPSCAASPKLNGFDWILERRLAGLAVGSGDVAGMGVGGLLKEIATRPQPRDGPNGAEDNDVTDASATMARHVPRIAAVVLAAGRSTRFGPSNKLLADLTGKAVVRHTIEAVVASQAHPVLVVTGHMADAVRDALAGLDVVFVESPHYRDGIAASLKAGLAALPSGIDGVLVALADMPDIRSTDIDRLISGFAPKEGRAIVVPVHGGTRGNPVVFAAHLIPEMRDIVGDVGAKSVIGRNGDVVAEIEIDSPRIFVDVDTPDALDQVRKGG